MQRAQPGGGVHKPPLAGGGAAVIHLGQGGKEEGVGGWAEGWVGG
jgi:hypothetical protein